MYSVPRIPEDSNFGSSNIAFNDQVACERLINLPRQYLVSGCPISQFFIVKYCVLPASVTYFFT